MRSVSIWKVEWWTDTSKCSATHSLTPCVGQQGEAAGDDRTHCLCHHDRRGDRERDPELLAEVARVSRPVRGSVVVPGAHGYDPSMVRCDVARYVTLGPRAGAGITW